MLTTETLYYHGAFYTWHHEPQNLYCNHHITILDAVMVIENGVVEVQVINGEERYKHIGLCSAGIIAVITDRTETRIITAWHASSTEVKEWLRRK